MTYNDVHVQVVILKILFINIFKWALSQWLKKTNIPQQNKNTALSTYCTALLYFGLKVKVQVVGVAVQPQACYAQGVYLRAWSTSVVLSG